MILVQMKSKCVYCDAVAKKHLFVSVKSLIIARHNAVQMQANSPLGRLVFIKLL